LALDEGCVDVDELAVGAEGVHVLEIFCLLLSDCWVIRIWRSMFEFVGWSNGVVVQLVVEGLRLRPCAFHPVL
jgi:hypothetical protein